MNERGSRIACGLGVGLILLGLAGQAFRRGHLLTGELQRLSSGEISPWSALRYGVLGRGYRLRGVAVVALIAAAVARGRGPHGPAWLAAGWLLIVADGAWGLCLGFQSSVAVGAATYVGNFQHALLWSLGPGLLLTLPYGVQRLRLGPAATDPAANRVLAIVLLAVGDLLLLAWMCCEIALVLP